MAGAHRMLKDTFLAFAPMGAGLLEDPGDTGTITFKLWGQICSLVSGASAETRTLAQPIRPGIIGTVCLDTDGGGNVTLTVTGGYNQPGHTTIVLADAGDFVTFESVKVGGSYLWRELGKERALAVTSATPSRTPSHTVSHTPSHTPSHTASST